MCLLFACVVCGVWFAPDSFDNHAKSIKFAEKTRAETEQRMVKLQSLKGVGVQAVSFLMDAVNSIIRCRRALQWTYVYAYYLPEPKGDKVSVRFVCCCLFAPNFNALCVWMCGVRARVCCLSRNRQNWRS